MHNHSYQSQDEGQSFFLTDNLTPIYNQHESKTTYHPIAVDIEQWFQDTAHTLKKKRETTLKQGERMREIQIQFQKRQTEKFKTLLQKLSSCSKNKEKGVQKVRERLRKVSERRLKVMDRVRLKDLQELKIHLRQRRSFEPSEGSLNSSVSSKRSKSSSNQRIQQVVKQIKMAQDEIEDKLDGIDSKQKHASEVSMSYQREKAVRARAHNSLWVPEVKKRAFLERVNQTQIKSQEAWTRLNSLQKVKRIREKESQQRINKKQKQSKEKCKRIRNNIIELEQVKRIKCRQLDDKFAKNVQRRGWHDPRAEVRNRRLLDNLSTLEKLQQQKAENIVEHHRQINNRNQNLRQRRDQLYRSHKNQTIN